MKNLTIDPQTKVGVSLGVSNPIRLEASFLATKLPSLVTVSPVANALNITELINLLSEFAKE